ncbi:MAG: carboxypeptidase-like regulatory domain-containing protein [Bryobacterales bacterium]
MPLKNIRLLLLLALSATAAFGQAAGGSISGLTLDSSGAAVPGAEITVTHTETGVSHATQSNESGIYRFPNLPIGLYALRAQAEGFQSYERSQVQVQISQTTTVDINFELGAVTETVTVSGMAAPLIQTEKTDVGLVVESKRFLQLPLTLGGGIRNPSSFIKLAPGVSGTSTWNKSVSGGGSFQDQTYYDGISLSRGDLSNDGEVNPPVDSIGEFKLITNNYSAEYSHALGAVTSFTLKSGTNELHGSGWEFFRNDKLDARGFFNSQKAPVRQNEWGVTSGGPVYIPKVYDGRNKTFWFYS